MRHLEAPWRMEYLTSPKPEDCIFCEAHRAGDDRSRLIVYRGVSNFVILNLYPYNSGHVMIAPYEHHARLQETTREGVIELAELTRESERILQKIFHPGGLNVGINLGSAAGAGIRDHYHLHIVPRWPGDTNFMTAVGEVRMLPESLHDTYDRLKKEYDLISK